MARQDKLNAENLATLQALIAAGGEVSADANIDGVNTRSLPKLHRMGVIELGEDTLRVTDAGYTAAGHDVAKAEPKATGQDSPATDEGGAPATTPGQDSPATDEGGAPAAKSTPATPAKPGMDRTAKAALAGLIFAAAGEVVGNWSEAVLNSPNAGVLAQVDAGEAAEQITAWLKYLPTKHWDARLPQPK